MTKTTERFLRYVQIDTMSEEGHDTTPSTVKQFDLARLLVRELEEIGASDVYLDEEQAVSWDIDPDVDSEIVWNNKVDICPDGCYVDSVPLRRKHYASTKSY